MSEHTPTPWHVSIDDTGDAITGGFPSIEAAPDLDISIIHVNGFKQEFWGDLPARKCVANAAFIVRACNSHDELVEAVDAALGYVRSGAPPNWDWLREVLARAKGSQP